MDLRLRTRRFALAIITLSVECVRTEESLIIRRQMVRSATSVGAHYRESTRARSNAEFISKLEVGLQELDETAYWLELLRDAKFASEAVIQRYLNEAEELLKILVPCVKNAKRTGDDQQ